MCGIAGKILFKDQEFNQNDELRLISKVLANLYHRGPDHQSYVLDKKYWLAATRLSIVDLSEKANQPFKHPSGQSTIIFNGEIYNFRQLKRKYLQNLRFISDSDTEVLLYLYEKLGPDCLNHLQGMFAFAIYDDRKKKLFLARDRLGKKPLKYFYNSYFFSFSSELKSLLLDHGIEKKMDYQAIIEYFRLSYIPSPKTGFLNINKLLPGHYMIVDFTGKVNIKSYWKINVKEKSVHSESETVENFTRMINDEVIKRIPEEVPWIVHLSGGVDSSIVAYLAAKNYKRKIKTVSVGFKTESVNEISYARNVAKLINSQHKEIYVKPEIENLFPDITFQLEEPFADPSILPTSYLMAETDQKVKVVLNGDGGDESFGGYPWYQFMKLAPVLEKFPLSNNLPEYLQIMYKIYSHHRLSTLARYFNNYFDHCEINSFISLKALNKIINFTDFPKLKVKRRKDTKTLNDLIKFDYSVYLPDDLLVKTDMLSMANSLEVRSPLLSEKIVDNASLLPLNFKVKNLTSKYLLKKIANKLMPGLDFNRTKQGFLPPLSDWFRHELKNFIIRQISDDILYRDGLLNKKEIIKIYYDHQYMENDYSYLLWILICYKSWLSVFFP